MANGAGCWVYPFRNGFRVYYRLEPGATMHAKAGFATRELADDWAAQMRTRITTRRRTVSDAIAAYRTDMDIRVERNELRRETAVQTEQGLRRLMADAIDLQLASLTPRRCKELYESLASVPGVEVGTHHKLHAFAHGWGTWVAKRGWFKLNPWGEVERIGRRKDHRDVALRVDEARALRDTALRLAGDGDQHALAALVVLTCSLRPSEVIQIVARDIDDDGHVLWVDGPRLKTRNTRRAITVADDDLRALLVAAAGAKAPTERLFPRERKWVTAAVKHTATIAGVPLVDSRALRRTFATLTARRGASLDDLAFAMGHGADGTARTARRHYIAPGAEQSGAAQRVMTVLDGGKRTTRR